MPTLPFDVIMVAAAALGGYNLVRYLRGVRELQLVAFHPMTRLGALAVLVFYLKGVNNGEGLPAGYLGNGAAALLALAAFSGLVSPVLEPKSQLRSHLILVAHVTCGVAGIIAAIVWVNRF